MSNISKFPKMKGKYPVAPLKNVSYGLQEEFKLTLPRRKSSVEAERLLPKSSFDFKPNYRSDRNSGVSVKNPSLDLYGIDKRLSRKGAIHGKINKRLLPGSSIGFGPNTPVKRRSSGVYGFEQTNTPVKKVSNYGFGNTLGRKPQDTGYIKVSENEVPFDSYTLGGYRKNNKQNTKKKQNRTKTKKQTKNKIN